MITCSQTNGQDSSTSTAATADSSADADLSLIKSVVLERAKGVRGIPSSNPTLLHSLINKINSGSCTAGGGRRTQPPPYDIIEAIASAVPEALLVQDVKTGRTPLHLAIHRNACPYIVECLVRHDISRKSLVMVDANGETPLLYHVRKTDDIDITRDGVAGILIRYDGDGRSLLAQNKKLKGPLFYVVAKELREAGLLKYYGGEEFNDGFGTVIRVPDAVRCMLVETQKALNNKNHGVNASMRDDVSDLNVSTIESHSEEDEHDEDETVEFDTATVLFAAIACSDILFRWFLPQVVAILIHEANNQGRDTSTNVLLVTDRHGNTPLHISPTRMFPMFPFVESKDGLRGNIEDPWHGVSWRLDKALIDQCPEALRHPNADGDLPMHIAVRTGWQWQHIYVICEAYPDAAWCRNNFGELPLHVALKNPNRNSRPSFRPADEVFKYWPDALQMRDKESGLYPFQIPSAREIISNQEAQLRRLDGVELDVEIVNISYTFLRRMPDVCSL